MDHAAKIKKQPAAAPPRSRPPAGAEAAAKERPTTLLDAYEVECIRRELERLVLKHNHQSQSAAAGRSDTAAAAPPIARGHRSRHDNDNLHLERLVLKHNRWNQSSAGDDTTATHGQHRRHDNQLHHQRVSSARKATSSAKRVSPSSSLPPPAGPKKSRRGVRLLGRHAVAICTGTVPVASVAITSGRGRRAVAICSGAAAAPVSCAGVGVGGGRRRPPGAGYREVEKV
ncbi:hypothetical protein BAE44_0017531 [Dichanthelium oligosanthes]|uniref:Uncharacterized protein n=1 Tax=Dichanthelium oligosanthes TaxID=888268 RepID=A0A1E5V8G0_9POAL|nr:hypothetical protein BAE44_0017531 [Dichanthelium oligosanthes]